MAISITLGTSLLRHRIIYGSHVERNQCSCALLCGGVVFVILCIYLYMRVYVRARCHTVSDGLGLTRIGNNTPLLAGLMLNDFVKELSHHLCYILE